MKTPLIGLILVGLSSSALSATMLTFPANGKLNSKSWTDQGWTEVKPGVFERNAAGEKQQIAAGEDALISDIASLKNQQEAVKLQIKSAKNRKIRAKIQDTFNAQQRVIESLELMLFNSKGQITDVTQLSACNGNISIEGNLSATMGIMDSVQASITAYGESFYYFSLPQAQVTVSALAGGTTDSDVKDIYTDYIGDSVSASANEFGWYQSTTPVSVSAYIVPACGVSGYRRATLSSSFGTLVSANPTSPGWNKTDWRRN